MRHLRCPPCRLSGGIASPVSVKSAVYLSGSGGFSGSPRANQTFSSQMSFFWLLFYYYREAGHERWLPQCHPDPGYLRDEALSDLRPATQSSKAIDYQAPSMQPSSPPAMQAMVQSGS